MTTFTSALMAISLFCNNHGGHWNCSQIVLKCYMEQPAGIDPDSRVYSCVQQYLAK